LSNLNPHIAVRVKNIFIGALKEGQDAALQLRRAISIQAEGTRLLEN
jgi:hypothetical protein